VAVCQTWFTTGFDVKFALNLVHSRQTYEAFKDHDHLIFGHPWLGILI